MPTAHGTPVFAKQLMSGSDSVLLWLDATASVMRQSIKPLYETVPMAAANDPKFDEFLALVDAIEVGTARESNLAVKRLDIKFKKTKNIGWGSVWPMWSLLDVASNQEHLVDS